MKSKKAEFNFVLLFAIIAGTIILVLAIYGATKAGSTLRGASEAEVAKSLDIITDPLQAGSFDAVSSMISFRKDIRIINDCEAYSGFGKNSIAVQSESSIGEEWTTDLIKIPITNKYIFSEEKAGKTFRVFSKPFDSPYRVSDLLFISSIDYCLISLPEDIAEELLALNMPNFGVDTSENTTCKENALNVCFEFGSNCNITVEGRCNDCDSEFEYGVVKKDGDTLYYSGNLLYGAIISELELYECNVERLLFRTSMIANLYAEKTNLMNMRDCNTLLKPDLEVLSTMTINATSEELDELYIFSKSIDKKASRESCRIW